MKRILIALLLVTPFVLAACFSPAAPAAPVEITVVAKEFSFSPQSIEITAGKPVRLTLQNTGTLDHDISIMQIPVQISMTPVPVPRNDMNMTEMPQLHMAAAKGASATIEFTVNTPGTYQFFCSVPGHKE